MNRFPANQALRAAFFAVAGVGVLLSFPAADAQQKRPPALSPKTWGTVTAPVYDVPEPDPAYHGSSTFRTPDLFAGPGKFGANYYDGVLPNGQIVRPAGTSVQVGMNPLNAVLTPDGKYLITSNDDERDDNGTVNASLRSPINKGGYSLSVLDAKTLAVVSQTNTAGPFFIGLQVTGHGPYTVYASGGADTDPKTNENSVKVFSLAANGVIGPSPTATILIAPITPLNQSVSNYTPAKSFSGPKPSGFSKTGAKITFPAGSALSADGKFLYVACNGDNSLAVISTATNTVVRQIPVGYFPYGVTVSPNGHSVYVANWGVTAYEFLTGAAYDAQDDLTALTRISPPDPADALFFVPTTDKTRGEAKTSSISIITVPQVDGAQAKLVGAIYEGQPHGLDALNTVGETHPCATALVSHKGHTILYVTKANSDKIGLIPIITLATASSYPGNVAHYNLALPDFDLSPVSVTLNNGHAVHGAYPNALAVSPKGDRVYVAEAGINSVAVLDTTDPGKPRLLGRIPTGWYPTGLALSPDGKTLYVTNAKGVGEDINPSVTTRGAATGLASFAGVDSNYIFGSVQKIDVAHLALDNRRVLSYAYKLREPKSIDARVVPLGGAASKKITHVIFIEQENKTFDSMLGTVSTFGPFAGTTYNDFDGTSYTSAQYNPVSLNTQALASAFATGVNYYSDSEESDAGHQFCASGTATDYTEKTLLVKSGRGLLVNKNFEPEDYPEGGYIFNNAARNGVSFKDYGDMIRIQGTDTGTSIPTTIDDPGSGNAGYPIAPETAPVTYLPGSDVTSPTYGLGQSYFMNLPILAVLGTNNKDGEPRLDHDYPGYNFNISDQRRAREFIADFDRMVNSGTLPKYIHLYLPNDHTGSIQAKNVTGITAANQVADGDVALGRVVRHIMASRIYYNKATDTGASIIMTFDDAQSTLDHIHPHRTPLIVVSPFAKPHYIGTHHYISASIVKTDELLLGLPPNNLGDLLATDLRDLYQPTYNGITAMSVHFSDAVAYRPTAEGVKIWRLVSKIDTSAPDLDTHRLGTLARLSMAADALHKTAAHKHRLTTHAYLTLQARLYTMAVALTNQSAQDDD